MSSKTAADDPRCAHKDRFKVMVTNQIQKDYDKDRGLRSVWVCDDPACVLDAMAWVQRGTGEQAWWRKSGGHDWSQAMPTAETTGAAA